MEITEQKIQNLGIPISKFTDGDGRVEIDREISERLWHAGQSWCYTRVLVVITRIPVYAVHRLQVSIRRNSMDDQSYCRVSRWDGTQWHLVADKHMSQCHSRVVSYTNYRQDRAPGTEQFRRDAADMLTEAVEIIG